MFSLFKPRRAGHPNKAVLCLPPFAEELNKSRRMLALQGRRIARDGTVFLLPDLLGTGDSAGDFADADYEIWSRDVQFAVAWLYAQGIEDIQLLGVRFGSLLADSFLRSTSQEHHRIVLWNPVIAGSTLLNQFFRTKLAAGMRSGASQGVSDLRKNLAEDGQMEIAGYFLTDRMVRSIDEARLQDLHTAASMDLLWIETGPVAEGPPTAKTQEIMTRWREQDVNASYCRIKGPQFWMTPEIQEVDELLEMTANYFGETA